MALDITRALRPARARLLGGRDPAPGVADRQLDVAVPRAGGDGNAAPGWRGVHGVGEQVQDHLLELVRVARDRGQGHLRRRVEAKAGGDDAGPHDLGDLGDEPVDVDGFRLARRASREIKELGDDLGDPRELGVDDREPAAHVIAQGRRRQVLAEQLEVSGHRVQRRADLVRDLGHDASGQRQAFGVAQRALHALDLVIAPLELGRRLLHPGLQLAVEVLDAREHLVEVAGQHAELVPAVHPNGRARMAGVDVADRVDQPADGPVHHDVDGEAHQRAHEQDRGPGQREVPAA
ncbi:MAG: hypothetical protein AUG80_16460 [Candidatus Rokubacteria bacterium 13_1_20CM_4_68_9]|nr:MAG: hypothetical protein AUG80_16460 [Candidatus Rokubacteria bacterium 13_1_20CM_4_68_9]